MTFQFPPSYVYRFFGAGGTLLYVGLTGNFRARCWAHKSQSPWYGEVVSHSIEAHDDRGTAALAEQQAILWEAPKYNVVHAVTDEFRQGMREAADVMAAARARQVAA